jgi:alcohol dehydrogenase class IV
MDPNALLKLRQFLLPEIVYGDGALGLAGRHAGNLGAKKALIVTDSGVAEAGWTANVEASLSEVGIPFAVFRDVTSNPKDHEVMAGVEVYRREQCDLILSVGGGSPMDCAKGIGTVVGNGGRHILEFEGVDGVPNPGPPMIFIPTTAGTSADISQFAIITDTVRRVKIAIISKMVVADISLVDPRTTVTLSPELTASTGMDALCHAFEAFVSNAASAITDMAAYRAVSLIVDNLPGAFANPMDMTYRNNMMMASLMAGMAFSNASLGLVHAMAHSMGGAKDLAHGECNAILLEKVVRFNFAAASDKYTQLARAMGVCIDPLDRADISSALVERIAALRKKIGLTQRLKDMGIELGDIPQLARNAALDPCMATNPRSAGAVEMEQLYKEIYQ